MINFTQAFGGGVSSTGGIVRQFRIITQNDTAKAPVTGKMLVLAVAAGGSGAVLNSTTATQRLAGGAGAGEAAFDIVDVTKDDTFTITLGAPGAQVSVTGLGSSNGNDAANTTITGPNSYSLSVEGGKRGTFASAVATLTGAAGGAAGTGGTTKVIRAPGGRGGGVSGAAGTARIATGAGAVNAMMRTAQTDTRGGDSTSTNTTAAIATGGGAPGGRGGDRTGTGTGNTGGGGAGGAAADNATTAGPNIKGLAVTTSPSDIVSALATYGIDYFGGGADANVSTDAGPGGGLGGRTDANASGQRAGNFGASAGIVGVTGVGNVYSGQPGYGAGSGAALGSDAGSIVTASAGGKAIVVVIFVEA